MKRSRITVAAYPLSEIPERYIRIRGLQEPCLICRHWHYMLKNRLKQLN